VEKMKITASNDNMPTLFGMLSSNVDELKKIANLINGEILYGDVDTKFMLDELKEIMSIIEMKHDQRKKPELKIV
jgi:hypothetical protein